MVGHRERNKLENLVEEEPMVEEVKPKKKVTKKRSLLRKLMGK